MKSSAPETHASGKLAKLVQIENPLASLTSVSWLGARVAGALVGGLVLRLWMMQAFPQVGGDALIYGNIAKNILFHGQFALSDGSGVVHSTLIRLPGYPIFLAACFRVFGSDRYTAVAYLQIALELGACLLLADFVRRITSTRAGLNTLWLATMCPFTAVYSSAPLTESLTFDMICLALWSLQRHQSRHKPDPEEESGCPTLATPFLSGVPNDRSWSLGWLWLGWVSLPLFTAAISYAAMLRPDGALLAIALWPALLFARSRKIPISRALRRAILCGILSILPFGFWTARNWQVFHVFEPLAPRYANDPGEDPHLGWQHWVKTWCIDFTCTSEIYWNVPDSQISVDDLPNTAPNPAFDSPQQRQETSDLISEYNRNQDLTPALNARFEALARQRVAEHPFRTHLLLPLGRLADMLFRPRVENLTIDLHWWEYNQHYAETRFSWAYAGVNLLFLLLGLAGFLFRTRFWQYMAAYFILRSMLLLTIEAPETRYTLEFFPFLFALGGITLWRIFRRRKAQATTKPQAT